MAYSTKIGDSQPKAVQPMVAALPLGIVTQAQILDKDDAVNMAVYSGKKLGAVFLMTNTTGGNFDIVVAKGSLSTDVWERISDGTDITPV